MLCPGCHYHTDAGFPYCVRCGRAQTGALNASLPPAELHPVANGGAPAKTGFSLAKRCVTLGRDATNDLVINDAAVSRFHARIWREPAGYRIEDLDSLNGTGVGSGLLRGAGATLADGETVRLASVALRFEQPRTTNVGGRTVMGFDEPAPAAGAPAAATPSALADGSAVHAGSGDEGTRGSLNERPRRCAQWALKRVPGAGETRYVLRNNTTGRYLQVTERDRFVWEQLDGEHTLRDLVFAYAAEFHQLALPRIRQLLVQLTGAGLLAGSEPQPAGSLSRRHRVGRRLLLSLIKMEVSIGGIDGFFGWLYRHLGWRFFTRTGVIAMWGVVIVGLMSFIKALSVRKLFDIGSGGIWGVVAMIVGYVLALSIHESAHALATKSYNRQVRRGGLMIMMAMPFAFVETTDMWLEGKRARVIVSLAGPFATAALAGACAIVTVLAPTALVATIFMHVALGLYINTLFNFNPLIPLDGYYALADWLGMPRLREEAGAYFRRGFWSDLVRVRNPLRWRWGLFLYGLVSTVGTFGFLGLGVMTWNSRLGGVVHTHVHPPFDTVVIVLGILLIVFPVWFGPVSRIIRWWKRRGQREVGDVEMEAAPA